MVTKLPPEAAYKIYSKLCKEARKYADIRTDRFDDGFAAGLNSARNLVKRWIEDNGGKGTT